MSFWGSDRTCPLARLGVSIERVATEQEHTALTDSLYEFVRRECQSLEGTWQLPGGDDSVKARLDFGHAGPPSRELLEVTIRRFSGGHGQITSYAESVELELPLRPGDHACELLRVGLREDPITDLLAQAFAYDRGFRAHLLRLVRERPGELDDWNCRVRSVVEVDGEKHCPDLVLFSRAGGRLHIIENKLLSGEGWKQTERYSAKETVAAVANRVGVEAKSEAGFWYLSLQGSSPQSERFSAIPYAKLVEGLQTTRHDTLGMLMRELAERIHEYRSWPPPAPSERVAGYLGTSMGFVTGLRAFQHLTEEVRPKAMQHLVDQGNGPAGSFCYAQFTKPVWNKDARIDGETVVDLGETIHLELQWLNDRLALHLHHETRPYRTTAWLKKHPALRELHERRHNERAASVRRHRSALTGAGWKLRKGTWQLATYVFAEDATTTAVRERIARLTDAVLDVF